MKDEPIIDFHLVKKKFDFDSYDVEKPKCNNKNNKAVAGIAVAGCAVCGKKRETDPV